jgi:hypothetical protein
MRVKDVRIVQHPNTKRPWEYGVWLEKGLQNEFYNLQVEDCSEACLYFYHKQGQGQSTTQLFQNCRFRQGKYGVIAEHKATITTRFVGCTVESCSEAAMKAEGVCGMTWVDPHVENVPLHSKAYPIFHLCEGSIVNIYGGRLGGYSPRRPDAPWDPDSSIFRIDKAKSISLNGIALYNAGKIFDVHSPPDQLTMSGVLNGRVDRIGELTGIASLHISGCTL